MVRGAVLAFLVPVAGAVSAGDAVDAWCNVMSSIPSEQITGHKKDFKAIMTKFSGMVADRVDCSVDPNNEILGYNLQGATFAECSAAGMKQQKAQTDMIGFSSGGQASCTEKIVDEQANTAAVWMEFKQSVHGHQIKARMAWRFNMEGDKIAGYHGIFDTYQIFNLQQILAREAHAAALPEMALAGTSPAGRTADKICGVFTAIGHPTAYSKSEMEGVLGKFSNLFADKFDVSEDPNNAMLGFNLHAASFAEFTAAKLHQTEAQKNMLGGMVTKWTLTCTNKIVDAETNNAALWLDLIQEDPQGHHLFTTKWAMRFSMQGEKIGAIHSVYDTFQLVTLSEDLARERAVNLSATAYSWAGAGALALVGVVAMVIAFIKKKEQKRYTLLDEACA